MKVRRFFFCLLGALTLVSPQGPAPARSEEKQIPLLTALSSTVISGYVDTSAHWNPGTGSAVQPEFGFPSGSTWSFTDAWGNAEVLTFHSDGIVEGSCTFSDSGEVVSFTGSWKPMGRSRVLVESLIDRASGEIVLHRYLASCRNGKVFGRAPGFGHRFRIAGEVVSVSDSPSYSFPFSENSSVLHCIFLRPH